MTRTRPPHRKQRVPRAALGVAVPIALILGAIAPAASAADTDPRSSVPPLLVQPAAGENLILNGSFEKGGLDAWIGSRDAADPLTSPQYGKTIGANGSGGAQLNTSPARTSRLIQQLGGSWEQYSTGVGELALAPGTEYRLTAKMKTTGGVTGSLLFEPGRLFDTKTPVVQVTPGSTSSAGWQTVTTVIRTGDQYAGGKIIVEAYRGEKTGEVFVDDVQLVATGGEFLATPTGTPKPNPGVLFDDFQSPALDTGRWLLPSKAWGGPNNGVVPENLSIVPTVAGDTGRGYLVMDAHGDLYNGPVTGVNPNGVWDAVSNKQIQPNQRVGSALATRDYYASGRYEVRAKIAPDLGAVTAFWTFHYLEDDSLPGGKIRNTEIDWEFPTGANDGSVPLKQDVASFDRARLNTWGGYVPGEGAHHPGRVVLPKNAQGQNHVEDGKFHNYRFDWYSTGKNGDGIPRIEWYLDGVLVHEELFDPTDTQNNIGFRAARYWLGVWFPAQSEKPLPTGETGWGGTPNFSETKALIDWVRITPFTDQANDRYVRESTPNFGYGLPHRAPGWTKTPTTPVDPVDPTDPVDPVDPVDPTDPVDPVEPVNPAANLLTNPGFEASGLRGWDCDGGTSVVNAPTGGGHVLSLVPSDSLTAVCAQSVTVVPGKTYIVSARVKNSPSSVASVGGKNYAEVAGNSVAALTERSVRVTPTSSTLTVYVQAYRQQAGATFADDVSVVLAGN